MNWMKSLICRNSCRRSWTSLFLMPLKNCFRLHSVERQWKHCSAGEKQHTRSPPPTNAVSLHNILHRRPRSQKLQNEFHADAGILDDGFSTQNFRIGCNVFELQHFYHCIWKSTAYSFFTIPLRHRKPRFSSDYAKIKEISGTKQTVFKA